MKKIAAIFLIVALVFNISGCDTVKSTIKDKENDQADEVIKATIAYNDREYIYNNGLQIDYKQIDADDKNKVRYYSYYPIISGLKNRVIQNQINNEIISALDDMLAQLELKYPENTGLVGEYNQKSKSANISYNFNNVIFVDFNASIDVAFKEDRYIPIYDYFGVGYDLNTGKRITLADIFKPGADYKNKINSFISQYIIENNFDDYAYEMMKRPYQGIREDQSFTLSFEGLMINFDEKNEDFVYNGYPLTIRIPLKYFGDDLYIFDKYFDEGNNIYEKSKLTKKLFPNKIEFIPRDLHVESTDKWRVSIMGGEFINLPEEAIDERVNAMLTPPLDVASFKKKAEAYIKENKNDKYYGDYYHNIEVPINAGGYLSVISFAETFGQNKYEQSRRTFNYDFNRNKEMEFMDLFINDTDIAEKMKKHIREMKYQITEAALEEGVKAVIDSGKFSFSEYHVAFLFSPKGVKIEPHQEWIWMSFEEFGLDNISLFN